MARSRSTRSSDGPRTRGGLRATPGLLTLLVALAGSTVFVGWGLVARDSTQVPVLCAGFAVYGLIFSSLALGGGRATYLAARTGGAGRALLWALLGGVAACIAAACFGLALVLALVLGA